MYDPIIETIASYTFTPPSFSDEAYQTARLCLADALGCAILSLRFSECTKLLGPILPNSTVPNGTRVPGTDFALDPILAAFNIGTMIRWLDYNDTWLAAEWGHPSDNLGSLLAVADYTDQTTRKVTVLELLQAMIQAYEIQGVLALTNSFNKMGFDHVILVKIASTAVSAKILGATQNQICDALTQAWIDTGPLRTYRHFPNTGSRKSWAAGDATRRGLQLAWFTMQGEMGYPSALSASKWGFQDVLWKGMPLTLSQPLESYVMENILFKIAFPAEFHAQTAVECALQLHQKVKDQLEDIARIDITTHNAAIRIIDKKGPLQNPADRDHCLQYMVAIALMKGKLTAEDYEDDAAEDVRIDFLRQKMHLKESLQYSEEYLHADKRSIANAITITFTDGSQLGPVEVNYPLGHRRRRKEAVPLLFEKFTKNIASHYDADKVKQLTELFQDHERLIKMSVHELLGLF